MALQKMAITEATAHIKDKGQYEAWHEEERKLMLHGAMHNGKRTSKRAAGRAKRCPTPRGGNFPHPRAFPAALGARALGHWVPRLALTPRLTRVLAWSTGLVAFNLLVLPKI